MECGGVYFLWYGMRRNSYSLAHFRLILAAHLTRRSSGPHGSHSIGMDCGLLLHKNKNKEGKYVAEFDHPKDFNRPPHPQDATIRSQHIMKNVIFFGPPFSRKKSAHPALWQGSLEKCRLPVLVVFLVASLLPHPAMRGGGSTENKNTVKPQRTLPTNLPVNPNTAPSRRQGLHRL